MPRTRSTILTAALTLSVLALTVLPSHARPLEGTGAHHAGIVRPAGTDPAQASLQATPGPDPQIIVEELTRDGDDSIRGTWTDQVSAQVRVRLDGTGTNVINMQDPSSMAVARITVEPGAQFPWHTHPGPVLVTVVQGDLTYVNADDCVERPYPAGTAFVDPGRGNVHTAFNAGGEDTLLYATFLEATAEGPLTITDGIEAPEDCETGPATE